MGNDPLQPVNAGTPLLEAVTAARLNALSEAARLVRDDRRGADAGKNSGRAPDSITIFVRNDTGTTFAINTAVQIGDPIGPPVSGSEYWQRGRVYGGILPAAAGVIYGITEEPILANGVGRVVVAGIVPVTLTITDAADAYADTAAASGSLTTSISGTAKILWKESGTGAGKRGVVQLLGMSPGSVADAAYNVAGKINTSDQYLGNGVKKVYTLKTEYTEGATTHSFFQPEGFVFAHGSGDVVALWDGALWTVQIDGDLQLFANDDATISVGDTLEIEAGTEIAFSCSLFSVDCDTTEIYGAVNVLIDSPDVAIACTAFVMNGQYGANGTDSIGNTFNSGVCVGIGSGGIDGGTW